jgi:[acyl-carrier-protein] S-malonyltransferase
LFWYARLSKTGNKVALTAQSPITLPQRQSKSRQNEFMTQQLGFLFPGQNSQHVGMLAELAALYPRVQHTFAEASEVLGYDLWALTQSGPAEKLALTSITQPAILTSSVAIWRVWVDRAGPMPALMAGHSLGEYSALVCAGTLQLADAVELVKRRGELMQDAVPVGAGGMAAVLGLDDEAVIKACADASVRGVVSAVNFNCPGQIVIAGESAAVEFASELCKAAGAKRVLPLSVSAPFHSSLMKSAAEHFAAELKKKKLSTPSIPVVQNYSLNTTLDADEIRENLILQIYNPVPWVATINLFADHKIGTVIEMGPGKVLTGFNKRIHAEMKAMSVNDPASLDAALAAVSV